MQRVFVGADRIAPNGDFANKIGTYSLAVLCKYHQVHPAPPAVLGAWVRVRSATRTLACGVDCVCAPMYAHAEGAGTSAPSVRSRMGVG